jgi:hypothetical protein
MQNNNYYGSNRDTRGHYVPNQRIINDMSHFQSNVYNHYARANTIIDFNNMKVLPMTYYQNYSSNMENSNKIILPSTILSNISQYDGITYPLIFKIEGINEYFSVLDFIDDIDFIYIPMKFFEILIPTIDNDEISITVNLQLYNKPLARGTMAKIQVHDAKFIELEDYKLYLENQLQKNYSILQEGTTIEIEPHPLLGKNLKINIIKTEPEEAILITDTDLSIEFEEPLNYKSYLEEKKEKEEVYKKENDPFAYWLKRDHDYVEKNKCNHLPVPYETYVDSNGKKCIRRFLNFKPKNINLKKK